MKKYISWEESSQVEEMDLVAELTCRPREELTAAEKLLLKLSDEDIRHLEMKGIDLTKREEILKAICEMIEEQNWDRPPCFSRRRIQAGFREQWKNLTPEERCRMQEMLERRGESAERFILTEEAG